MKHILTTIAAVLVVGCGKSQQSAPAPKPEPPTAKVPDISIYEAAWKGNIEAIKQHLVAGTDVDVKNDKHGLTPLHGAAIHGHKEIVELLIAEGADVNAKTNDGETPLVYAKGEIADLLHKHGGKTAEELKGGEPVAEVEKPEPPTAKAPDISIHDAAGDGNIEAVKEHIAAGTDLNAKGNLGLTPLHEATRAGRKGIVKLLIAGGADVNAKSEYETTPLHFAAFADYKEAVELLIAKGAEVNARNNNGGTPLDSAIWIKETEIADLLRKHGGKTGEELKAEGN
jgi:ankyrin repeat protein